MSQCTICLLFFPRVTSLQYSFFGLRTTYFCRFDTECVLCLMQEERHGGTLVAKRERSEDGQHLVVQLIHVLGAPHHDAVVDHVSPAHPEIPRAGAHREGRLVALKHPSFPSRGMESCFGHLPTATPPAKKRKQDVLSPR